MCFNEYNDDDEYDYTNHWFWFLGSGPQVAAKTSIDFR